MSSLSTRMFQSRIEHAQDIPDFPQTIGEDMALIKLNDGKYLDSDTILIDDYRRALEIGMSKLVKDNKVKLKLQSDKVNHLKDGLVNVYYAIKSTT